MLFASAAELQKPRLETNKAVFLAENGLILKCAHLGSNQGPKDYESSVICKYLGAKSVFLINNKRIYEFFKRIKKGLLRICDG